MKLYWKPVAVMIISIPIFFLISFQLIQLADPVIKYFEINGRQVKVTHQVDPHFYGCYEGAREGYLWLKEDGTGEYLYDIQVPSDNCEPGVILFEWGFIVDENERIVRFKRDYGSSYPVLLKCMADNCFQGCRVNYMVDYIMEKKNGILEISSSDDWVKTIKKGGN
jgi:hypothetical protein